MAKAFGAALRNLRRAPAFTGLVVLTLALGIGATTAMFSVVDAVLLNPLPYPNSDRFGEVQTIPEKGSRRPGASTAALIELSRHTELFTAVGGYQFGSANVTGDGDPEIVGTSLLSPGMLAILGVQPSLGNWFTDEDAAAGNVVLLSERYWIRRFGADPLIVGKAIMLDDRPHRVVGVMPNRFRFPEGNFLMWRPLNTTPTAKPIPAQVITVRRPELTREQVNDRLLSLTPELRAGAMIRPTDSLATDDLMQLRFGKQTGGALYILFGAVGLVMLVACVNVMNLLLVRSSARSGEFALRSALGASGSSLVRSVLLESVLLAAAGGTAGIALGRGLLSVILATAPPQMMFLSGATSGIDARALGFAIALAIATCVIFGVLPAWRAVRVDAIDALKQRAASVAGSRDDWWQGVLVTAQLALVLVLLAGSGLLLRSFGKLLAVDTGFTVDELAVVDVPVGRQSIRHAGRRVGVHAGARAQGRGDRAARGHLGWITAQRRRPLVRHQGGDRRRSHHRPGPGASVLFPRRQRLLFRDGHSADRWADVRPGRSTQRGDHRLADGRSLLRRLESHRPALPAERASTVDHGDRRCGRRQAARSE